jgi:hypothetical protein
MDEQIVFIEDDNVDAPCVITFSAAFNVLHMFEFSADGEGIDTVCHAKWLRDNENTFLVEVF